MSKISSKKCPGEFCYLLIDKNDFVLQNKNKNEIGENSYNVGSSYINYAYMHLSSSI